MLGEVEEEVGEVVVEQGSRCCCLEEEEGIRETAAAGHPQAAILVWF